jgi:hypothetical protein
MSKKIEITAEQLASLDLLISQKQARIKPIGDNVPVVLVNIVASATAATAFAQTPNVIVAGGCKIKMDAAVKKQLTEMAGNIRLEDLIEFRNNTVLKK